jgi:SHS2 domain-containing protein
MSKSQRQREREREREVRIAREDTFYYLMNVDSGEHLSIDMSKIVRKELQIEENQVT